MVHTAMKTMPGLGLRFNAAGMGQVSGNAMKASRIDVALPDDSSISNCDVECGMESLIKANGRAACFAA